MPRSGESSGDDAETRERGVTCLTTPRRSLTGGPVAARCIVPRSTRLR